MGVHGTLCCCLTIALLNVGFHVQGLASDGSKGQHSSWTVSDGTVFIQAQLDVERAGSSLLDEATQPVAVDKDPTLAGDNNRTVGRPLDVEKAGEAWGGVDGNATDAEALREMGAHPFWDLEMNQLHHPTVYVCSVVLALAGILCAAGGIGGGGIYVTVLMVLGKMSLLDAVPLSQAIVFVGSISTMVLNTLKAQESAREARALIDYDLCRIVVPFSLSGTFLGVILNRHLPGWLTLLVLTGVLVFITVSMVRETLQQYSTESEMQRQQSDSSTGSGEIPIEPDAAASAAIEAAPKPEDPKPKHSLQWFDMAVLTVMLTMVVLAGMLRFHTSRCARSPLTLRGEYCNHRAVFWLGEGTMEHLVFTRRFAEEIAVTAMVVPLVTCTLVGIWYTFSLLACGWPLPRVLVYGFMALGTGVLSGLLGIGGGLIFSPFFLLMGHRPSVAVSSSSTCVLITSSSTALQYLLTDRIIMSLTFLYGAVNLVASYLGTKLVHWLQDRMKARKSIISGIVAFGVFISTILALVKLWPKLMFRFAPMLAASVQMVSMNGEGITEILKTPLPL